MAIGQGRKPVVAPPQDAKRLVGNAIVGQIGAEMSGNSAVGARNRAMVVNGANAVGGAMANGLNQVNPNMPTTSRGANDLAGAMLQHGAQNSIAAGQGPANVRPSTGIGANFGANLQGRLDGTIGSRASGGVPGAPLPSATMGPPPARATNGRPDFPQLGGVTAPGAYSAPSGTPMRAGPAGSLPTPQLPPFNPTQSTDPYAGAEAQQFGQQGALPIPQPTPGYAAPSGQRMLAGPGAPSAMQAPQQGPAPIQGPSMDGYQGPFLTRPLQSLAGDEAIRSLQNSGMLGERIGQVGTNMAPTGAPGPLGQALLSGQNPITGPTGPSMASEAMRNSPGGLLTDAQAAQNYRNSPADSRYMPSKTVGGRYGQAAPGGDPNSASYKEDVAKAQSIARQGNFREAKLSEQDSKFRTPYTPPTPKPEHDFGLKPSGQFETDANGRTTKKGGYSSVEQQAQADAKATFDARRGGLDARKAAYEARNAPGARAMQARDNPTPRQINSQERAQARSENRRYQQGKLTMGERLAFSDPEAASRTALGKAQIDATNQRAGSQDQFRLAQLQQQEQNNVRNNQTARANSQDRLTGQYAAGGITPPAKPSEGSYTPPTPDTLSKMSPTQRSVAIDEHVSPFVDNPNRLAQEIAKMVPDVDEANSHIQRITGNPKATVDNPTGSPYKNTPGAPPKPGQPAPPKKPQSQLGRDASERYGNASGYAF